MTAAGSVAVKWLDTVEKVESLREEWLALEAAVGNRTVFSSFDWIIPWYRHYCGSGRERYGHPLVGTVRSGGSLVGVAPLVMWKGTFGRIPARKVLFAGFNSEAGEFLIRDEEPELFDCVLRSLLDEVRFDVACLNNFDDTNGMFDRLRGVVDPKGLRIETVPYRYAFADLSGGYEGYAAAKGKNFRRQQKRHTEKIASAGTVKIDRIAGSAADGEISRFLDRTFSISDSSWKSGTRGPIAGHHRLFYRDVASRFGSRGMLHIDILSIDSRDAAYVIGLGERCRYYDVTISYKVEFSNLGPGTYLMNEVVRTISQEGAREIISHGDHDYKGRWATEFRPVRRVFIFSRSVRAALARCVRFKLFRFKG